MRRVLATLACVVVVIAARAFPWTVATLTVEALYMQPGYVHTQAGNAQYWQAKDLEARLAQYGWKVRYMPGLMENDDVFGQTIPMTREIQIDESLSWDERYNVLAHEAGHTMQPPRMGVREAEVFAESVAAVMTPGHVREHARYLSSVKAAVLPTLLFHFNDVYRVAAILEGR